MFAPCIILVRPQLAENVGGVARVMYNFGLADFALVNPRNNFTKDELAISCACAGAEILKSAKIFASLKEAVADLDFLYATTARRRDLQKICINSREISIITEKTGVIFGPENSGLSNEDLTLVDTIISIEVANNPLNLVQAASIICYELLSKVRNDIKLLTNNTFCDKKELDFFYNKLENELDEVNFFQEETKRIGIMSNIKAMFSRLGLSSQEVRTLLGVIHALKRCNKNERDR